jgi:bifunctional N-acetylglucosamine-1-phosphate-uridyltransferase/glucosamine-1-phosphate-acetyltransferase GlmU-like protein
MITVFKKKRFNKFLVVVGVMAEQVLETVSRAHQYVMFAYQHRQLGTGHAGKIAAEVLKRLGHKGPILVTMGDKYIEPVAIEMLLDGFIREDADMSCLTIPRSKSKKDSSGRVFVDKTGRPLDIIEQIDIAQQAVIDELRSQLDKKRPLDGSTIVKAAEKHITNPKKMAVAVPELLGLVGKGGKINRGRLRRILRSDRYGLTVDGKKYTARQIERKCTQFNPSLYLFKADAFYKGISMIDNNNTQGEYYLTDVIRHLNSITDGSGNHSFHLTTVKADRPDVIQGFNSLDQLLSIMLAIQD